MLTENEFFDEESLKKLIYESLYRELPKIIGEISIYDTKQILFDITQKIVNSEIEWADPETFGKNKMLIFHKNKVLQLDANELIKAIRTLHREYVDQTGFHI